MLPAHDQSVFDGLQSDLPVLLQPRGAVQSCYGVEDAIDDVMGVSSAAPVREQHVEDASYHPYAAPDAFAFAQSTRR